MIYLSFDIEEFDLPTEYGKDITYNDQIRISAEGLQRLLGVLEATNIRATFFSTVGFFEHISDTLRQRLLKGNHEIASHGMNHTTFSPEDYAKSKQRLEELSGQTVRGFRMPRMMPIDYDALRIAGYLYDSSLNPTCIPGRYNHLSKPRLPHRLNGLWELPAGTTPLLRFPLFWLSFHALPLSVYKRLTHYTEQKSKYLNIYFHPWEFADIKDPRWGVPSYIRYHSGQEYAERLQEWILYMKSKGHTFGVLSEALPKGELTSS